MTAQALPHPDSSLPPMDSNSPFTRTVFVFGGGLLLGLVIAALLAIYITNAPVPFVNKVQRPTETIMPGADGKLPDPNKALYAPERAADLPKVATPSADGKGAPAEAPSKADTLAAAKPASPDDGTRFLLQAGAFRTPEDADSMRARLAMLGLDARIFPIEQGDRTLYRVRLGPYGQVEDINRIRKSLAENGIDAQVVRLK